MKRPLRYVLQLEKKLRFSQNATSTIILIIIGFKSFPCEKKFQALPLSLAVEEHFTAVAGYEIRDSEVPFLMKSQFLVS